MIGIVLFASADETPALPGGVRRDELLAMGRRSH